MLDHLLYRCMLVALAASVTLQDHSSKVLAADPQPIGLPVAANQLGQQSATGTAAESARTAADVRLTHASHLRSTR